MKHLEDAQFTSRVQGEGVCFRRIICQNVFAKNSEKLRRVTKCFWDNTFDGQCLNAKASNAAETLGIFKVFLFE